jgi:hypothetical protein
LVDRACSHDGQRQDGLNVNAMNIGYGGTQRMTEGCLGAFDPFQQIGDDTQEIIFSEKDDGPLLLHATK